jgi:integrase
MVRCRPASQNPASRSGVFGGGTSRRFVAGREPPGTYRADSRDRVGGARRIQVTVTGQLSWIGVSLRNRHPLRNRNLRSDVFDSAVDALALAITPHNMRDTAASLAIQEGASVVAVARLLGHESAATTLNHYAGLFPTDLDDIASRLNAAAQLTIASQRAPSDTKCQVPVPA